MSLTDGTIVPSLQPEGLRVFDAPELAFERVVADSMVIMEFLQETLASRNIVAWVILIILLILFIKLLKSMGKGLILFAVFCAGVFVVAKYFPGIAEPIADFVRGGWLGDQHPEKPW